MYAVLSLLCVGYVMLYSAHCVSVVLSVMCTLCTSTDVLESVRCIVLSKLCGPTVYVCADIGDYVLRILNFMVFVHDEVIHTVEPVVARSIMALLSSNVFQAFLDCIQSIDKFSTNGLRQVSLVRTHNS